MKKPEGESESLVPRYARVYRAAAWGLHPVYDSLVPSAGEVADVLDPIQQNWMANDIAWIALDDYVRSQLDDRRERVVEDPLVADVLPAINDKTLTQEWLRGCALGAGRARENS